MEAWSSGWSDSQKKEILKIAENAIQSINELTNIVGRSSIRLFGSSSSADSLHSTNAVQEDKCDQNGPPYTIIVNISINFLGSDKLEHDGIMR